MKPWKLINEIEKISSTKEKKAIIEIEAYNNNDELFTGLRLAYDPLITFGISQIPESKTKNISVDNWEDFLDLTNKLQSRELTGNAAKEAINNMIQASGEDQWNHWYRRILMKDLRAGVGVKTINSAVNAAKKPIYKINVFSCMRASDTEGDMGVLHGMQQIEAKLDGVRLLVIVRTTGEVQIFTRNGRLLTNFPHLESQFNKVSKSLTCDYVFDGEIMSSTFQDLMTQVNRKYDVDTSESIYYVFDWLPLEDFNKGICNIEQQQRSDSLREFTQAHNNTLTSVATLNYKLINVDENDGLLELQTLNARMLNEGYEGLVAKDPTAPYVCKRSKYWMKLKPFIEVTLKIVGIEEGTGRNKNKLGALICEGTDLGYNIKVNVGSGFSDHQRKTFWDQQDDLIGHLVEIRADAVSKSKNNDDTYSLRFPRFLRFRSIGYNEKI